MITAYKAYLVRTVQILRHIHKKLLHLNFQDVALNLVDSQQTQPVANSQSKLGNVTPRNRPWQVILGIGKQEMDLR